MRERLSFEECESGCKKMWNHLALNGRGIDGKTEALYATSIDFAIKSSIAQNFHDCFACYFVDHRRDVPGCDKCPIDWGTAFDPTGLCPCEKTGSPYEKWRRSTTAKTRKKYAAIIRDLPWTKLNDRGEP